jgi:hypothetical protein
MQDGHAAGGGYRRGRGDEAGLPHACFADDRQCGASFGSVDDGLLEDAELDLPPDQHRAPHVSHVLTL